MERVKGKIKRTKGTVKSPRKPPRTSQGPQPAVRERRRSESKTFSLSIQPSADSGSRTRTSRFIMTTGTGLSSRVCRSATSDTRLNRKTKVFYFSIVAVPRERMERCLHLSPANPFVVRLRLLWSQGRRAARVGCASVEAEYGRAGFSELCGRGATPALATS